MQKKHEHLLCDTVVHFIAKRKNLTITEICYPDKAKKNNEPSVDRLIKCSGIEIVLEHTLIESYPEQIADRKRVSNILGPLQTELAGQLPTPGHYNLLINVGVVKGVKNSRRIRSALTNWIKAKAPFLQVGSPNVAPCHYIREKPPGVPFEVTLYRFPGRDGELWTKLLASNDLDAKRKERIRKALDDKCPKLYDAKGNMRFSILLLESDDIFLANCCEIAKAVSEEFNDRDKAPDEVYLLETEVKPWAVWVLKEEDRLFNDIENSGPYYLRPDEKDTENSRNY